MLAKNCILLPTGFTFDRTGNFYSCKDFTFIIYISRKYEGLDLPKFMILTLLNLAERSQVLELQIFHIFNLLSTGFSFNGSGDIHSCRNC